MTKPLKTTESIPKWIAGINSGILQPNKSTNKNCGNCQLLQVENQRLKQLIANMMQSIEDIEEFNNDK